MRKFGRLQQIMLACIFWLVGIGIFWGLSWWNVRSFRGDAENSLINDAGRAAAQLAGLLGLAGPGLDDLAVRQIIASGMEDERVYAISVDTPLGVMEGQRRNYLWEPIPWDDEIAENCVRGTNPVRIGGQVAGKVNVWLSERANEEEISQLASREIWRFSLTALIWSLFFALGIWIWLHYGAMSPISEDGQEDQQDGVADKHNTGAEKPPPTGEVSSVVNEIRGRQYQTTHPEAWFVTAGMFRQTFARGPELINRLYSSGEDAGLCHLGRMLELAAPCIGASKLLQAAQKMQNALNDPECASIASPVEECALALEEVLDALRGAGQWRTKSGK